VIRDIGRRIAGDDALEEIFVRELSLARRFLAQGRHQHGPKVYSLHAMRLALPMHSTSGPPAFAPNSSSLMESEMLPIDRVFRTVHLVVGQPREVTNAKIGARLENENLRSTNNSIL
jgi:hypothetical protein